MKQGTKLPGEVQELVLAQFDCFRNGDNLGYLTLTGLEERVQLVDGTLSRPFILSPIQSNGEATKFFKSAIS